MVIKALIFDLDGTLANTLMDLADATNYALEQLGYETRDYSKFNHYVGNGMKKLLIRASGNPNIDNDSLQKLYDVFIKRYSAHYCDKTIVYENETEVIDKLINKGYKLAVITNKVDHMAKTVVKKLYGDNKFSIVLGQCDAYPTKPDRTVVDIALKEMGVRADECLFIGDSDVDIFTGRNAGMKTVGVLWGFRTKEELISAGADYIIEKPEDLLSF